MTLEYKFDNPSFNKFYNSKVKSRRLSHLSAVIFLGTPCKYISIYLVTNPKLLKDLTLYICAFSDKS